MRLSDLSISFRLWISVLVPLVALVVVGRQLVLDQYGQYEAARHMIAASTEIQEVSGLIHRLQVERGLTAGFLASKGKADPADLASARAKTDEQATSLSGVLAGEGAVAAELAALQTAMDKIAALPDMRGGVDALRATPADAFKFYTGLVSDLLTLSRDMAQGQQSDEIAERMTNFLNLAHAKELAGQERGMGNGFINAGHVPADVYMMFSKFGGAQDALLKRYAAQSEGEPQQLVERFRSSADQSFVEAYRQKLLTDGGDRPLQGLAAKEWFAKTTAGIESLRQAEIADLTAIRAEAEAAAAAKFKDMAYGLAATLGAVLATVLISASMTLTVVRPLKMLVLATERFAREEEGVKVAVTGNRDEIGRLSAAIVTSIDNQARKSREEAEERQRAAEEKLQETERHQAENARRAAELHLATQELALGLDNLARGDLTRAIDTQFASDLEPLRASFNLSIRQLRQTLESVSATAAGVTDGVSEMRASADELAERTQRQAAALEEAAASINEIRTAIGEAASRAQRVGDIASATRKSTEESSAVMQAAVGAM
jgi:methyl-accepting chemotaxis protein